MDYIFYYKLVYIDVIQYLMSFSSPDLRSLLIFKAHYVTEIQTSRFKQQELGILTYPDSKKEYLIVGLEVTKIVQIWIKAQKFVQRYSIA